MFLVAIKKWVFQKDFRKNRVFFQRNAVNLFKDTRDHETGALEDSIFYYI